MIVYGDAGFREYLDAKFSIDSESLNKRTLARFSAQLMRMKAPVLLDIGTGTAAMIRRVVDAELVPNLVLYGVDPNRDLLEAGRQQIHDLLQKKGYSVRGGDQILSASKDKKNIEIHLVAGDIFDAKLQTNLQRIKFTGTITHAFMDIVPIDLTLQTIAKMLPKGGLFYSTINYDGTTEMLPFFEESGFERQLLAAYNKSMDEHSGEQTGAPRESDGGGSRTGSILYDRLLHNGFSIAGFGSSDWSIFPWNGSYSKPEEIFLNSLILTIYEEGLRHPELDRYTLSAWYADRSQAIEERSLSLISHQTDIFALKR